MRRPLALAAASAAVLVSGCAVGDPKPVTYVTDVSVTLNGDVYSSASEGQSEIYVMDADGTDPAPITDDPAEDATPAWSPRP